MIELHPNACISPLADIEDSILGTKIIIGSESYIDSFVKIKPAGGIGDLVIGSRSIINSGCVLYTGNGISIGSNVAIAANCTLAPTNHNFSRKDQLINEQGFMKSRGGIIIEDDVWIGANCIILDGSHLSTGVVVGAGSIVRGRLSPYGIYMGNPLLLTGHRK